MNTDELLDLFAQTTASKTLPVTTPLLSSLLLSTLKLVSRRTRLSRSPRSSNSNLMLKRRLPTSSSNFTNFSRRRMLHKSKSTLSLKSKAVMSSAWTPSSVSMTTLTSGKRCEKQFLPHSSYTSLIDQLNPGDRLCRTFSLSAI